MNKSEFSQAFALAKSPLELPVPYGPEADWCMGFGLPEFEPVTTTLTRVAGLIRYQALQFDGQWDMEALNEVARHGRRKFRICG